MTSPGGLNLVLIYGDIPFKEYTFKNSLASQTSETV